MRKSAIIIILILFCITSSFSDQDEAIQNITSYMKFISEKTGQQLNIRKELSKIGFFNLGNYALLKTALFAGNKYIIIASGDSGAANINIEIFDSEGKIVMKDHQSNRDAYITFEPQWTNNYQIKITLVEASSGSNGGYVAFFTTVL